MDKIKFDELLLDKSVIKFGESGGAYFSFKDCELTFYFFFHHRGNPFKNNNQIEERIGILTPLNPNLGALPLKEISEETLVLVNYDDENFAFTFKITIDKINRQVIVKVIDMPKMGQRIMTEEEINGIGKGF